ncbi:MAG: nitroreductase family protein, partial [Marinicaulis sp.]|nr:nitroreductase family protein [Marinicaulis sp.]
MTDDKYTPLSELDDFIARSDGEMQHRAAAFLEEVKRRHTIRDYTDQPVPREIIENCIAAAGRAPSGANHQPWHFCLVGDNVLKNEIRIAAEEEERA